MARRANGEGSVYQRADGRWCASIRLGGRRRVLYGKARREVLAKLSEVQRAAQVGRVVAPSRLTVATFLNDWLDAHGANIGAGTRAAYEDLINLHIAPDLGTMRLQALRPLHIIRWQSLRRHHGVSAKRVAAALKVLRTALAAAVTWGLIPANPAAEVGRGRGPRPERAVWNEEQARAFLAQVSGYTQVWDTLWLFLLGSGLRRGEALGLTWADVDLQAGTVRVTRAVQVVRNKARLGTPKTPASTRAIALPPFALGALKVQRQRQAARRLAAGSAWRGGEHVFTTAGGEYPLVGNLLKALRSACEHAGVPRLTLHGLRRQHATLAIRVGADPKTVQRRLGHASLSMTLDVYAQTLASGDRVVADALGAFAASSDGEAHVATG